MTILQIINELEIGGAQQLLANFLPILQKQHKVEILVLKKTESPYPAQLVDAGIAIHYLNVKSVYYPLIPLSIRRFLKRHPYYDIIHVHLFPSLYWTAIATMGMNCKLVWTEHSTNNKRHVFPLLRLTDRMAYSCYDKIVCISQATENSLKEWIGDSNTIQRLCVVGNGINIDKFKHDKPEKKYPHTLIQISRFEAAKDQDTVIRAMAQLPQDVHLLLVGDGTRLEVCKELSRTLKVDNRVHFLGSRTDIALLLSSADIAIQSSHWEGFGLTAVEAMAAGLPVIASEVNGLKQVVEGAGLLFPQGDANALAKQVESLLNAPQRYDDLSKAGLERARKYDINIMVEKYIDIYKTVVEEKS